MSAPGIPLGESLERLPGDLCRLLAAVLGGDNPDRSKRDLLPRLERWLGDPERLLALVARLPGPGRAALELLCEAPDLLPESWLAEALAGCLGDAFGPGLQALAEARLLIESKPASGSRRAEGSRGLLPPLARPLRRLFDGLWLQAHPRPNPDAREAAPPALFDLKTLALLAHLANLKPKVTMDGALFKTARKKLEPLLAGGEAGLARALGELGSFGLLQHRGEGRLQVDEDKLQGLLSRPIEEVQLGHLARRLKGQPPPAVALVRYLARRPGWHPLDRAYFVFAANVTRFSWGGIFPYSLYVLREEFQGLLAESFLELSADRKAVRLTAASAALISRMQDGAAPPAAPGALRPCCHLQPNFELVVPAEAGAQTIFAVGRLGRLKFADRVATFVLDQASIRAAAGDGLTAAGMLETLEKACAHGVPPNVAQGIRDFAAGVRRAQVLVGLVALVPDGAPAPGAPFAPSGAPGVFLADPREQRAALVALERQGYCLAFRQAGDPRGRRPRDPDAWDDDGVWDSELGTFVPSPFRPKPLLDDTPPNPRAWLREALELTSDTRPFAGVVLPAAPSPLPGPPPAGDPDRPRRAPAARPATPEAVQRAIREGRDLGVWTGADPQPLRVTPHFLSQRGKVWTLAGHLVGSEELRLFPLPDLRLSAGKPTEPRDVELAAEARAQSAARPQPIPAAPPRAQPASDP